MIKRLNIFKKWIISIPKEVFYVNVGKKKTFMVVLYYLYQFNYKYLKFCWVENLENFLGTYDCIKYPKHR